MVEKAEDIVGLSQAEFESKRRAVALSILQKTDEFIAWDLRFNEHLSNLAEELINQLKSDPRLLKSKSDILDQLKTMQAERAQHPGTAEGDLSGADVLSDMWDIIKDILKSEKEFIKDIIKGILGI